MNKIVEKLQVDTDNIKDIVYREKIIGKTKLYIIFSESLTDSNKISDFIIRSLNKIQKKKKKEIFEEIKNDITNNKIQEVMTYDGLCSFLHAGFTVIVIDGLNKYLVLETKGNIFRSVDKPESENTYRGAKDAFTENYQINVGLIKRRIRSNKLRIKNFQKGKYTKTDISVISISGKIKNNVLKEIYKEIENIDIDGIINEGDIKNLITKKTKAFFPIVKTTERPDIASLALLNGKAIILIDNCPYVLIVPAVLNDFFKTTEDMYGKKFNVSLTRIIKYIAFFISLLCPGIYIALITFNQGTLPTDLLINFSIQRDGVPFPAFFEAIIMMLCFEILRESDLRIPGFSGSTLSIVGALVLGDAAVNAGIVSPIMIIVIAITAISSLLFTEPELINALRIWRIFFMIGATTLGIIGEVIVLFIFIIHLSSLNSFNEPYLSPFSPFNKKEIKDSVIKLDETGVQNEKN